MRPVSQTRIHGWENDQPPGNCFQACLASIFECEIDDVPDEAVHWKPGMSIDGDSYRLHWSDIINWLAERNLTLVGPVEYGEAKVEPLQNVWCIISGMSLRDPSVRHAVVGLGDSVKHDPHPSRKGLGDGPRRYYFFMPIHPERNALR